ncbi:hypothetical protein K458DRAFT_440123 [Lentithecium fluviatile CBS 122367]|uniref:MFS general substrate transporter n=1 Tax=Lentithecium fluviatile CBS 122367 TaxID=1168545 RepID=A0A6G1JE48_9PLEO|nr:hypothetical protein K458DRAFT_440123 [Lentithecium fluviatile CBS 122367]
MADEKSGTAPVNHDLLTARIDENSSETPSVHQPKSNSEEIPAAEVLIAQELISSYLLGYVGVLVIFAKLSDIVGHKSILALPIAVFIVFSEPRSVPVKASVEAAASAIASALITEIMPPEKFANYAANQSSVYPLSLLTGQIMGAATSSDGVPAAVPAPIFTLTAMPKGFTYHKHANRKLRTFTSMTGRDTRGRFGIIGAAPRLLATLSLVAGFEEADARFPWRSTYVIALLTIFGLQWIALLLWERHITDDRKSIEPVLPWRFAENRAMIGLVLDSLLLGGRWIVTIFQLVDNLSALQSGIRLMPFTFAAPPGSAASSTLASKFKILAMYLVLSSALLQTLGFALLATLPESGSEASGRMYGYQVIAGFGCRMNISMLLPTVPFVVEFRDEAVGMAAISQLRPMGGVIVLAIATAVFNGHVTRTLLSGDLFAQLPGEQREHAREVLAHGYNLQMIVFTAFAAAQVLGTALMWQGRRIKV